jgi:hypothetical protein
MDNGGLQMGLQYLHPSILRYLLPKCQSVDCRLSAGQIFLHAQDSKKTPKTKRQDASHRG